MKLALIVAMARNRVIGHDNKMPWHISKDLQRFKKVTLNSVVIMGRKNFESIIQTLGKPLPKRTSIIISRDTNYKPTLTGDDCHVVTSIDAAIILAAQIHAQKYQELGQKNIFIIGGGQIYTEFLKRDIIEKLYLTIINQDIEGDVYMPEINLNNYRIHKHEKVTDDSSELSYEFLDYQRK